MGATKLMIHQLGWVPAKPDKIKTSEGDWWRLGSSRNRLMEDRLCGQAESQLWRHASEHYGGGGMQTGVDISAALRLHARFIKKEMFKKVAIVEAMVNGSCWFQDRFNEADPEVSDICTRCGLMEENAHHAIWGCRCNLELELPGEKYWKKQASTALPCLWTRGIVPKEKTTLKMEGEGPWR